MKNSNAFDCAPPPLPSYLSLIPCHVSPTHGRWQPPPHLPHLSSLHHLPPPAPLSLRLIFRAQLTVTNGPISLLSLTCSFQPTSHTYH